MKKIIRNAVSIISLTAVFCGEIFAMEAKRQGVDPAADKRGVTLSETSCGSRSDAAKGAANHAAMSVMIGGENIKILTLLSTQAEVDVYRDTWNPNRTLAKNQEVLLKNFMAVCTANPEASYKIAGEALREIVNSAVGCKLLRMLIAKCTGHFERRILIVDKNIMPKQILPSSSFIVTCGEEFFISFVAGELNPIYLLKPNTVRNEIISEKMPRLSDCSLFHEMLHWLHYLEEPSKTFSTDNIPERLQNIMVKNLLRLYSNNVHISSDGLGPRELYANVFTSAEEYRTMIGMSDYGFDSLNESMYLISKGYGCIRYVHISCGNTLSDPQQKNLTDSCVEKALLIFGDSDLYDYYLSGDSSLQIPRFGFGNFRVADFVGMTEKK
ncbi:MAG: hypothetical protein LBO73_00835 [Holosporaceae bacterium]|jgi:hypothetical protein|nr:hypothetical protein [Holosporaceae bacterium]